MVKARHRRWVLPRRRVASARRSAAQIRRRLYYLRPALSSTVRLWFRHHRQPILSLLVVSVADWRLVFLILLKFEALKRRV